MEALEEATGQGVTGWVKNLPDGRVEVTAEGEEDAVAAFVEWCRKGPAMADVTQFEAAYSKATGEFDSFSIRHRWQ